MPFSNSAIIREFQTIKEKIKTAIGVNDKDFKSSYEIVAGLFSLIDHLDAKIEFFRKNDKEELMKSKRKSIKPLKIELVVEFNPMVPICEDIEEGYFYFKDENHDVCRVKEDEYIQFMIDGIGERK